MKREDRAPSAPETPRAPHRGEKERNVRCRVLVLVQVSCRLERLESGGEVPSLLLKDDRNLLFPVGGLAESTLLLIESDRALESGDGN